MSQVDRFLSAERQILSNNAIQWRFREFSGVRPHSERLFHIFHLLYFSLGEPRFQPLKVFWPDQRFLQCDSDFYSVPGPTPNVRFPYPTAIIPTCCNIYGPNRFCITESVSMNVTLESKFGCFSHYLQCAQGN